MNQILVSQKVYVTKERKRKRMIFKSLYIICILIVIALSIYYVFAEKNRNDQEAIGQDILSQLSDEDDSTVSRDNAIVIALDDSQEENDGEPDEVVEDPVIIPDNSSNQSSDGIEEQVKSSVTTKSGKKYNVDAIIYYKKLGIKYSVLSEESDALLKISVCKYWGPNPNEVGNYCIVGHNYRSGKMFGKLSEASNGDEILLKDLSGNTVTYIVYNKYVVEPTDVSCTSQLTNGAREITLITCTNQGKKRLVVKAREK